MAITAVAPVVAGVDGSPDARLAVELAAWEADRRQAPLRLVCGFRQVYAYGVVLTAYDLDRQVRDLDDMLNAESARIARRYPDLAVTTEVVGGAPASVLVDESAAAPHRRRAARPWRLRRAAARLGRRRPGTPRERSGRRRAHG